MIIPIKNIDLIPLIVWRIMINSPIQGLAMSKVSFIVCLLCSFLLSACQENDPETNHATSTQTTQENQTIQQNTQVIAQETAPKKSATANSSKQSTNHNNTLFNGEFANQDLPIDIKRIDKKEFMDKLALHSRHDDEMQYPDTDFDSVKTKLADIVVFDDNEKPIAFHFRNGGYYKPNYLTANFFAYYDNYDILVLKDEYKDDDISFHLATGKETNRTGNGDYIAHSPNKKYRLNAYQFSENCKTYFIEKQYNHKWEKIIEFDTLFNRLRPENKDEIEQNHLCNDAGYFWVDDNTLYFSQTFSDAPDNTRYYQVNIKQDSFVNFDNIKKSDFPLEIQIDYNNYKTLPKITYAQAKNFAGLFSFADDMRLVHRLEFSPKFDTIVLSVFSEGGYDWSEERSTYLINLDSQGNILDYLLIGSDIAESDSSDITKLTKDKITLTHINRAEANADTYDTFYYQINDKGEFILKSQTQERQEF